MSRKFAHLTFRRMRLFLSSRFKVGGFENSDPLTWIINNAVEGNEYWIVKKLADKK